MVLGNSRLAVSQGGIELKHMLQRHVATDKQAEHVEGAEESHPALSRQPPGSHEDEAG